MKEQPKKVRRRNPVGRVLFGAVLGFMLVNLFRGGPFALLGFAEVFQRLWSWVTGSGGESAEWGEPLYYLCYAGWPGVVAGGGIAFIWELIVQTRQRRNSSGEL